MVVLGDNTKSAPDVPTVKSKRTWLSVLSVVRLSAGPPTRRPHPAVPLALAVPDHVCVLNFDMVPADDTPKLSPLTGVTPPDMFAGVKVIVVPVAATTSPVASAPAPRLAVSVITAEPPLEAIYLGEVELLLMAVITSKAVWASVVLNGTDALMRSTESTDRLSTDPAAPVAKVTDPVARTSGVEAPLAFV